MTLFKEIRGNSFENWIDSKKLLMKKYSVSSRSESYKIKKFCWSCNGKLGSSNWFDSLGSNLVQCEKCGLIQSEYIPSEEILGELYNDKLYNDFYDEHVLKNHNKRKDAFGRERVKDWLKYYGKEKPTRVLEIGCGSGFTLSAAKDKGLDVYGLELSNKCVEFCNDLGLKNVFKKELSEFVNQTHQKFDVIALYDVLEHMPDPLTTIRDIKKIMNKDGLLTFYVPNADSFIINTLDSSATQWVWQPFHLSYFNKKSLGYLLNSQGFTEVYSDTVGMDIFDIANFIKQERDIKSITLDSETMWKAQKAIQSTIDSLGVGSILRYFCRINS